MLSESAMLPGRWTSGMTTNGPRAADGMFEGVADQPVAQREDQGQHEHADARRARALSKSAESPASSSSGRKRALPLAKGITTSKRD